MTAGYVRLSRDDDKKNYVSIENQKLIITQYATDHGAVIDRWYEDDGVSGYIFDRPGFQQMMADLDQDVDTVYVKDFSRLGRHNAKVLLLLDEFQERGKHLIVIDDNYDSMDSSDGKGGFKDWMQSRSGAVPGVTLEVGKNPCPVPFSEYPVVWQQNKGVWIQALDYVERRI